MSKYGYFDPMNSVIPDRTGIGRATQTIGSAIANLPTTINAAKESKLKQAESQQKIDMVKQAADLVEKNRETLDNKLKAFRQDIKNQAQQLVDQGAMKPEEVDALVNKVSNPIGGELSDNKSIQNFLVRSGKEVDAAYGELKRRKEQINVTAAARGAAGIGETTTITPPGKTPIATPGTGPATTIQPPPSFTETTTVPGPKTSDEFSKNMAENLGRLPTKDELEMAQKTYGAGLQSQVDIEKQKQAEEALAYQKEQDKINNERKERTSRVTITKQKMDYAPEKMKIQDINRQIDDQKWLLTDKAKEIDRVTAQAKTFKSREDKTKYKMMIDDLNEEYKAMQNELRRATEQARLMRQKAGSYTNKQGILSSDTTGGGSQEQLSKYDEDTLARAAKLRDAKIDEKEIQAFMEKYQAQKKGGNQLGF